MSTTPIPADNAPTWHTTALERLSRYFERDPDARAVVVSGSLAADDVQVDEWSDIDIKVVLADHAVDRYFISMAWLEPFGHIIGLEKYENPRVKTLRVCLEGYHRFDFVFVAESVLGEGFQFRQPCKVLWTKLPDLDTYIAPQIALPKPSPITGEEIVRIADAFWFKATVAIGKVARNDLLIAAHLALDLARDCLVLQMMRRDREKGTTVHRTGGWGNELIGDLFGNWEHNGETSAIHVLDLIQWSGETFDTLAADLAPGYTPRASYLIPTLDYARRNLCT